MPASWFDPDGSSSEAGARLGKIQFQVHDLNERIRAREAFRASSQALDSYHEVIESYDEALLDAMALLRTLLEEARADLEGQAREAHVPTSDTSADSTPG